MWHVHHWPPSSKLKIMLISYKPHFVNSIRHLKRKSKWLTVDRMTTVNGLKVFNEAWHLCLFYDNK